MSFRCTPSTGVHSTMVPTCTLLVAITAAIPCSDTRSGEPSTLFAASWHVAIPRSDTRSGELSHPRLRCTASIPRRRGMLPSLLLRLPSLGVAILALVNCLGKQRTAGKTYRRVNAQTESTQNEQIQQSTRREEYATINRVGATFAIGDARMAMLVWRCLYGDASRGDEQRRCG